jgi:hypothetical protein
MKLKTAKAVGAKWDEIEEVTARARAIPVGEPTTPSPNKELAAELNKEKLDP